MNFQGSLVALITPFDENSNVDYFSLKKIIEWHIDSGTHGIVAAGTTAEAATLSLEEQLKVIQFIVETVNKRVPVIAGTGSNSTQDALYLTKEAESIGVDASLVVVPYYNKPTQEGLFQHFKKIADSSSLPQILYNVPSRTVLDMNNDTIVRLSKIENIVACKEASGDVDRIRDLRDRCPNLHILSGDDATALSAMKLGAKGNISVTANIAPKMMSALCEAALNGNYTIAEQYDNTLRRLHNALFIESNPIPVKYALFRLQYIKNYLRLPLTPLSPANQKIIDECMVDFSDDIVL